MGAVQGKVPDGMLTSLLGNQLHKVIGVEEHVQSELTIVEGWDSVIPIKREGRLPSQKFDVAEYLKRAVPEATDETLGQADPQQSKISPKIISQTYSHLMRDLIHQGPLKIKDPFAYPYSAAGLVVSKKTFRNSQCQIFGSGSLIGPNTVLTCAHNCYQINIQKQHQQIQFIPSPIVAGIKSKEYSGKGFKVKEIYIPTQYRQMKTDQRNEQNVGHLYDFAVLVLETEINLEKYFGSFSYDFGWQEEKNYLERMEENRIVQNVQIIGYPRISYQPSFSLFKGSAISDTFFMLYTIETLPGVSGSPLLFKSEKNESYSILAIHQRDISDIIKTGNSQIETKAALKLNRDMFEHINEHFKEKKTVYTYEMECLAIQGDKVAQVVEKIEKKLADPCLLELRLGWNKVGDLGCLALTHASFVHLKALDLWNNQIGDKGCETLAKGVWPRLECLGLADNKIGAEGCRYLAQAQSWDNLKELFLSTQQAIEGGNLIKKEEGSQYFSHLPWHLYWWGL